MTPSATPLLTRSALERLRDVGLSRLALSLDGVDAKTHDAFRGVPGSFDRTFEILSDARAVGLPLQVNTTITSTNLNQIDGIANLLASSGIVLWSVFFLVPVGRGALLARISPQEYEWAFERLCHHARHQPYAIKTTEAPHFRRFLLRHRAEVKETYEFLNRGQGSRAPLGINDGKGVMFIDHSGRVFPSGFLPIECGRFPDCSVVETYQSSDVFRKLRDPDQLNGKCGICEFRHACGGSRARAYAVTGDPLAPEPDCIYEPRKA